MAEKSIHEQLYDYGKNLRPLFIEIAQQYMEMELTRRKSSDIHIQMFLEGDIEPFKTNPYATYMERAGYIDPDLFQEKVAFVKSFDITRHQYDDYYGLADLLLDIFKDGVDVELIIAVINEPINEKNNLFSLLELKRSDEWWKSKDKVFLDDPKILSIKSRAEYINSWEKNTEVLDPDGRPYSDKLFFFYESKDHILDTVKTGLLMREMKEIAEAKSKS